MDIKENLFQAVRDGNLILATEIISTYGLSYSTTWEMGYKLLLISTKNRRADLTKLLLNSGAKVNRLNTRRKYIYDTPLHFAAQYGQLEIVKMLLDKGANIHAKNETGATALQTSVLQNKLDVVEFLLSRGAFANDKRHDGLTCLHTAARNGNLGAVKLLLKYKANVNDVCYFNDTIFKTALHFAAEKGNVGIVEILLKNGAICDTKAKAYAPIYLATLHRKHEVVKQLLKHGANVDTQDNSGKTLLYIAVEHGNLKMVEVILKHSPDLSNKMNKSSLSIALKGSVRKYKSIVDKLLNYGFNYDFNKKLLYTATEKGYTQIVENCLKNSSCINKTEPSDLLHIAVKKKNFDITEMLIDYGLDVNGTCENDKTPIFYATHNDDLRIVKLLLNNGASVTKCSGLLMNAISCENIEMVKLLLEQNVNVNETDCLGFTALHAINDPVDCSNPFISMKYIDKISKLDKTDTTNVKEEITEVLITAGADVNAQTQFGRTALHYACLKGYRNVVEVLFKHNAKMIADETGELPLHCSAHSENVDILKMLISKGADINAKTKTGRTVLHIANDIEFLRYILDHGANIIDEKENENGFTALHVAAKNDKLDLVELFLKYGADTDCTDNDSETALYLATKHSNNQIVKALLEYGCDISNQNKKSFTPFDTEYSMDLFGQFNDLYGDNYEFYVSDYEDFDSDSDSYPYYGSDFNDCNDFFDGIYEDDYDYDLNNEQMEQSYLTKSLLMEEILQHHIIMMKTANLEINDGTKEPKGTSSKYCTFKTNCENEVKLLKSAKICEITNVTYYDIISKPVDNIAFYTRNPKILEVLKKEEYKVKFPLYCGLINGKIIRGINRRDTVDRAYVFFDLLADTPRLPYNCIENICSFLSDKDLRTLAESSKFNN